MRVRSREFAINYTADGAGPPLVLLAATLSSAEQWRTFGYLDALARTWRVIAIDPLGHGSSDTPHDAGSYSPDGVIDDIVAVLDNENIDSATVWGYSRGGWLACRLAATYPERVDRLVVGGYAMHAHEEEVGRLLGPLGSLLSVGDWDSLWAALGVDDADFRRLIEESNDPIAIADAIKGSLTPTRYIDPHAIQCPATYYVGSEDWIVDHVRADAAVLNATVDVIPGQAHVGAFWSAADQVLAAVMPRLDAA